MRGCLETAYQPIMGNALFLEYESLLVRSSLFAGSMLNESERETLLNAFLSVCRWINYIMPGGLISGMKGTTTLSSWPSRAVLSIL
jgi:hypothetical protein